MKNIDFFPIFLIILFPIFSNILGGAGNSQFIINILFFAAIFIFLSLRKINFFDKFHILFFVYLFAALSIAILSYFYDTPLSRTFSDTGRLFLFAGFFHMGFNYVKVKDFDIENLSNVIINLGLISVIFSFLVFIEYLHPFVDLFKGRQSTEEFTFHFYRFSGFHGYPTDFAVFINFCILLVFFKLEKNLYSFSRSLAYISIFSLGILFSFARGGMLQFAGLILVLFYISPILNFLKSEPIHMKQRQRFSLISFIAIIFFFFVIFLIQDFLKLEDQYVSYLVGLFDNNIDSSVQHRFNEIILVQDVLNFRSEVPFGDDRIEPFGMDTIESMFSHYTLRFGWFGFCLIVLIYAIKLTLLSKYKRNNSLNFALFYWFLTFFIFVAFFSDVTVRLKGLSFYSLFLGVGFGYQYFKSYNQEQVKL